MAIMSGTVDGIDPGVSPSKAAAVPGPIVIGAITTVNNKPTAQLKGKFEGTVDGQAAAGSGSGQGPVDVGNIGGTNVVTGTATYKAKVGEVSYSQKNVPLALPVGPAAASHIHKSWNIALTITNTASAGAKSSIMASEAFIESKPCSRDLCGRFKIKNTKGSAYVPMSERRK